MSSLVKLSIRELRQHIFIRPGLTFASILETYFRTCVLFLNVTTPIYACTASCADFFSKDHP